MGLFGKKQVDKSIDIVDKLVLDKDKKAELAHELITNENQTGSSFTRYARPAIIYFGLFLMFTEIFGVRFYFLSLMDMPEQVFKQSNAMLEYFIFTWGGLSTVYVGGKK